MKIKYQNKLSIPFLIGLWCLLYILIYIGMIISLVFQENVPKEISGRMVYFIVFSIGCFLVFLFSPIVMLKRDWGRQMVSLGFHLVVVTLSVALLVAPSQDTFAIFLLFIIPIVPILLILNSQKFISYFPQKNKKSYNKTDVPDSASASPEI